MDNQISTEFTFSKLTMITIKKRSNLWSTATVQQMKEKVASKRELVTVEEALGKENEILEK